MRNQWPDALIETPDLPGAGDLHKEVSPTSLEHYIPLLEQQLSQSDDKMVIVGLSLGGMLALTWASLQPDRIEHVVTINSSSRLSPFYHRLQVWKAWRYPGAIFRKPVSWKEGAIYRLTCNRRPVDEETVREWVDIQTQRPVSIFNQIRQIRAALFFHPPKKSEIPSVSVIYSKADRLVHPNCSEKLAQFYETVSYTHDWGGHDLSQDDPQWVASAIHKAIQNSTGLN